MALTNNAWAHKLNMGKLTKEGRKKCTKKTVVKYISKSGRPSYKGTPELKSTQPLAYTNAQVLFVAFVIPSQPIVALPPKETI